VAEPERPRHVFGPYPRELRGRTTWRVITERESGARETVSFDDEGEANAAVTAAKSAIGKLADERSICDAVAAYIAAQERRVTEGELQANTVERDGYHLRSLLQLVKYGSLDIRRLTPRLGEQLYDERIGAVDTHRNGLAVCKTFGAWCVRQRWLRENPFGDVKGRGRRKRGKPQLRIDEARRFQATCLEHAERDVGAVLSLGYLLLGARAGEIVLREVRDVDDGGRVLWIPDSKTQAGRRELGVPDQLAPHLAQLAKGRLPRAPLFEHAATRQRPQDWAREQVWRLCKLAGVPRVTPQGLRGTLATMGREVGNTSQQVADLLGHASPTITDRSYIDGQRAAAAERRTALRVLAGGQAAPTGEGR
jgi:integrase